MLVSGRRSSGAGSPVVYVKKCFSGFQNSDKMRVSVFSVFAHSFVTLVCSGPPVFNLYRVFSMVFLSRCHSVIGLFVYHSQSVLVYLSFLSPVCIH